MQCEVVLKNDKTIYVDGFNCIEYPNVYDGIMKQFKSEDLDNLELVDGVTYTIIGSSIAKVKGEQILFIQFK
ncbi:hypothetical protein [Staphylococcus equorum]|uniref:hypothetical protein n=1 Tax=Staphylococcus equorum TaxID=246432 RepID=UPI002552FB13|nr:hypothetical protein [Staphylococcus equorum]MDK9858339.1 hypothetical protein [Staphylococcus equorum]MDK9868754.1 hypothetical protein [Staphylococcus equorum]MDK9875434.1 hypothetical protein [Staphylococcus equorum]MDN6841910.1 hypothetical protein [Staphylococcus equorum]MDN6850870.1 hypothetical protein [Staphylococcus equorum]